MSEKKRVMIGNPETGLLVLCADVESDTTIQLVTSVAYELAKYTEEKGGLLLPDMGPLKNVRLYTTSDQVISLTEAIHPEGE